MIYDSGRPPAPVRTTISRMLNDIITQLSSPFASMYMDLETTIYLGLFSQIHILTQTSFFLENPTRRWRIVDINFIKSLFRWKETVFSTSPIYVENERHL